MNVKAMLDCAFVLRRFLPFRDASLYCNIWCEMVGALACRAGLFSPLRSAGGRGQDGRETRVQIYYFGPRITCDFSGHAITRTG